MGNHREAVRLNAAITTTFTDLRVHHDTNRRILKLPFFPAPSFFSRTDLFIDKNGSAFDVSQLFFDGNQIVTMINAQALEPGHATMFFWIIAHKRDPGDAFTSQLQNHLIDRQGAVNGLATGHGNGIVIQNLISDINSGGYRLADRQQAGMKISAIPQILEYMFRFSEVRLANPGNTFAAHLGKGLSTSITDFPGSHIVTTNTTEGPASLRHPGGGAMGAARTVMWSTLQPLPFRCENSFLAFIKFQARFNVFIFIEPGYSARDGPRNHGRC